MTTDLTTLSEADALQIAKEVLIATFEGINDALEEAPENLQARMESRCVLVSIMLLETMQKGFQEVSGVN